MTRADRLAELLSVFAGVVFTLGVTLLGLGLATGRTAVLIAGLVLLLPLTAVGVVVGRRAWNRQALAPPRRYHAKPSVADWPSRRVPDSDRPGGPLELPARMPPAGIDPLYLALNPHRRRLPAEDPSEGD
jgi:hypothetical protein